MRVRKLAAIVAIALILLTTLALWVPSNAPAPPTARVVSFQPSITDDNGMEMQLVTLAFSNSTSNALWIKDGLKPASVRVSGNWHKVEHPWIEQTLLTFEVWPGRYPWEHECFLHVPVGTEACQIPVLYTGPAWSLKGCATSLAMAAPKNIRSRLPFRFWRWALNRPLPSSNWHKMIVEIQIPQSATSPASTLAQSSLRTNQ